MVLRSILLRLPHRLRFHSWQTFLPLPFGTSGSVCAPLHSHRHFLNVSFGGDVRDRDLCSCPLLGHGGKSGGARGDVGGVGLGFGYVPVISPSSLLYYDAAHGPALWVRLLLLRPLCFVGKVNRRSFAVARRASAPRAVGNTGAAEIYMGYVHEGSKKQRVATGGKKKKS